MSRNDSKFGIPEYWLIDLLIGTTTLLLLNEGFYDETVFSGNQTIKSLLFSALSLKVENVSAAGEVG